MSFREKKIISLKYKRQEIRLKKAKTRYRQSRPVPKTGKAKKSVVRQRHFSTLAPALRYGASAGVN